MELFRRLLRMLILLLAIMPVVSCSNLCTEGAIRATMLNAGCDAVCNSSFDILWEYCCLEACFLWVTGTDWNGAGTTSHSFGPALGANRDAPATRRAQQVGAAAAAWITAGGPLPPLLRGKTFRPALVAPKSPC